MYLGRNIIKRAPLNTPHVTYGPVKQPVYADGSSCVVVVVVMTEVVVVTPPAVVTLTVVVESIGEVLTV